MSEAQHLSDSLAGLFSHADHGWFTPFPVAVSGLTAAQAATVPAIKFNSVWAVVNHIRFWQEITLLRLQGLPMGKEKWADNGWPPAGAPTDEAAWKRDWEAAIAANAELARYIATLSDETLSQPMAEGQASRWQVIQGLISHNSYHINEIISIRHMQRLWLEQT
jgi:hypothetical protein